LPNIPIAAPATAGLAAAGALVWILVRVLRRGKTPAERERRRRIRLHVNGRLAEATVYQAEGDLLHYGYEIGGVAYDTVQDISLLHDHLPCPPEQLIGPALAKYDPKNPANSIVACEHWQGFQVRQNQL
jgi:hypothetical protein